MDADTLRPLPDLAEEPVRLRYAKPRAAGRRPSPFPQRSLGSLRRTLRLKRVFDLVAASSLLVLTAPLVGFCMLLVRLTSSGPAIYTQERVGRFGRVFTMYKLRTMYHQCERETGPTWCLPDDPRITRVGQVLRRLHIDELPQMINILRGEMSLIGPRPERPEIAARLARTIDDYNARLAVQPGITGHAQIHLAPDRTVADVREKTRLDREYLSRFSFGFDMLTLGRTALKVVGLY
jgi:lipopolysaccharide/colanic/teichoic acid biosynthesis glycosyltransferase